MRTWRPCAVALTIAAFACLAPAQPPVAKTPAFALLDSSDAPQWQTWAKGAGWQVIVPSSEVAADAAIDVRAQALAAAVQDAIRNSGVDAARVYLAGRGAGSAAVFYAASRLPDVWAAAFALGGSPQAAIDSGIVFAANFTNMPILWAGAGQGDQALAEKLKAAGLNLEWRSTTGLTIAGVIQWLAGHARAEFPTEIDCETNSVAFARCYWTRMTKFDPAERNDVLPSTRLRPGSGAALDLGGFSYKLDDPGPGLLVSSLPPKYDGPLKMGDRILELDGKPIENPRQFEQTMRDATAQTDAVILVARGAERKRIETRILIPERPPLVTARVQAKYLPDENEIRIVTRTVTELRVTVPPHWVPATLYWNGLPLEEIRTAGCLALTVHEELLHSEKCP
jgi:predicted esterase